MSGGNKNIHNHPKANSNGFDKNPDNINKTGLQRKLVGTVNIELEEKGVKEATKSEITSCYLRLINLPISELMSLVEEDDSPALIRIVAKAILSGKGFDVISNILDRAIGKPNQATDITTNGKEISNQQLPTETINKLIDKL